MPRRKYNKRDAKTDLVYNSLAVAKLVNLIMMDGKKDIARSIVYEVMDRIKETKKDPLEVLETVIQKVGPKVTVRPRRIGGASYMVPKEVIPSHRMFLGLKWIIDSARARSNKEFKTFADKLYAEMTDALEGKGAAFDKKLQTEKLAEANKVFAHFAW